MPVQKEFEALQLLDGTEVVLEWDSLSTKPAYSLVYIVDRKRHDLYVYPVFSDGVTKYRLTTVFKQGVLMQIQSFGKHYFKETTRDYYAGLLDLLQLLLAKRLTDVELSEFRDLPELLDYVKDRVQ